jgi:NAD(P)-dependent dehydrogenase (short-subunit alcohol dehydrogenase family)
LTTEPPPLAVVSGGTSGIGLSIAERLAQDGYELILLGRDAARGEAAVERVQAAGGGPAHFLSLASDDFEGYASLVDLVGERPVRALVAAAGIGYQARILETPVARFQQIMAVNVAGPLRLVQALAPRLQPGAAVVLISSDAAIWGEQATGAYSVSKAAVNMLGRMLALDLAEQGVRVNVVCPGDIVPGMRYMVRPGQTVRDPDEYRQWPIPPRGRWGEARDVAEMVAFLVSDRADFAVGAVFTLDGGSRAGVPDHRRA